MKIDDEILLANIISLIKTSKLTRETRAVAISTENAADSINELRNVCGIFRGFLKTLLLKINTKDGNL